jgi:hypothetical protein
MKNRRRRRHRQLALFTGEPARDRLATDVREAVVTVLAELLLEALGETATEEGGGDEQ